jgi:S-adenosylmethionine-diacylgycerolhomoserine-N-methlytransferase
MTTTFDARDRMDRMYTTQRHFYDITRKFYLLGRDQLVEKLKPAPGNHVIEIGCGTGRNLVRAARRYPNVNFVGIDISTEMLATAKRAVARAGLDASVRVAFADATMLTPSRQHQRFDRAFISYSLSMIPEWRGVLEAAARLLAPNGELHIVDFGDQRGLPAWSARALRAWLALFDVTPRDELAAEMELMAFRYGGAASVERPFLGYTQYAVLRLRG